MQFRNQRADVFIAFPKIPDAVTAHHLTLAGLSPQTTPLPLQRLLALATQKFIADIAADAYQYSRMRSSNTGAGAPSAAAMAGAVGTYIKWSYCTNPKERKKKADTIPLATSLRAWIWNSQ